MHEVIIITDKPRFKRLEVSRDADYLYLFSDNADRTAVTTQAYYGKACWYRNKYGKFKIPRKTQAIIRGVHNAYPITTLRDKYLNQWSDKEFNLFKETIDDDIQEIKTVLDRKLYKGIKLLDRSFGNEKLSALKFVAPRCYSYLQTSLASIGIDNEILQTFRSEGDKQIKNYVAS